MLSINYILVVYFCLFRSTWAQDPNCDFQQNVQPGQNYYVYNRQYPSNYTPGTQCRWIGRCPTGYNCKLSCNDINLPYTQGCTLDALLISKTGDPQLASADRYCGVGSLDVTSVKQDISIALLASPRSPGGRFSCLLTAVPAAPTPGTCRCGYKKTTRIVGGQETGVNEFPMMAGLVYVDLEQIKCGGVIISPRHILTAAHCLERQTVDNLAVIVGEHDYTQGADTPATQGLRVASFTRHPQYNSNNNDNDIAIVRTTQDILFSESVGPVCLPFKFATNSFAGAKVTALGWGTTSFGGAVSPVLRKVDLNVISQAACRQTNPAFLSDRQMCTLTPGKDSCQDDSGGPLLFTDSSTGLLFSVGAMSSGRGCAVPNSPAFSTRITEFLSWIRANTDNYNFCVK